MKEYIILTVIYISLKVLDKRVDKWVERSKSTANTWDDWLSMVAKNTINYIFSIIKFKK